MAQLISLISPLFTPIIAGFVAYIAWMQWKLNQATLREKLFDRRFELFTETQRFLTKVVEDAEMDRTSIEFFKPTLQRSKFLLGIEFHTYLLQLWLRAIELWSLGEQLKAASVSPDERQKLVEKKWQEAKWLAEQLDVIFDKFDPYLSFSQHK